MTAATSERVGAWRHARAIALLPFVNVALVPGALLALFPMAPPQTGGAFAASIAGTALVVSGLALVVRGIVAPKKRVFAGIPAQCTPRRSPERLGAIRILHEFISRGSPPPRR